MTIPIKYRKVGEGSIASYNFTDMIAGLGYITFYGVMAASYAILSREPVESPEPQHTYSVSGGLSRRQQSSYALLFNNPQIIGAGDVYISASEEIKDLSSATSRIDGIIYKRDGKTGTETLLGQASGALITWQAVLSNRETLKINIPKTKMVSGDTLVVVVEYQASGTHTHKIQQDGANRGTTGMESGYVGTQVNWQDTTLNLGYKNRIDVLVQVPFKVDL